MIQVENLTKYYDDVHAVDQINFELQKGEIKMKLAATQKRLCFGLALLAAVVLPYCFGAAANAQPLLQVGQGHNCVGRQVDRNKRPHRPSKVAGRFSRKATTPSRKSRVCPHLPWSLASRVS